MEEAAERKCDQQTVKVLTDIAGQPARRRATPLHALAQPRRLLMEEGGFPL